MPVRRFLPLPAIIPSGKAECISTTALALRLQIKAENEELS